MSESTDPLTRAIELSIEFESAGGDQDVDSFLAEHEELRDILEPLLRRDDTPDERPILGDFELVRELGRGGMGVVYEAIQNLLGRTVALKLLPPHRALSPRSLAMFRREATLAASLDHPGIAKVLEFQEIDGQLALAMELIDGIPLDDVIEQLADSPPDSLTSADLARATGVADEAHDHPIRGRGSYERNVVELARQVADALAHAHSRGVVHRDVKPGNILITPDGRAVLTDFGLAREEGMLGVTRTGEFAGTYQYAAPEQLEGRLDELDGKTDVYALGATLYEMLTLRRPLEADSLTELVMMIRREDPVPPSRINPRVSPDVEAVLLCALEKERKSRYASAEEFATDLANVIEGRPVKARRLSLPARSTRWMNRNRLVSVFVAMLFASIALISVFAVNTAQAEEETSAYLQRWENLWVGAALDNLIERAGRAHPPWPDQLPELRKLVSIAEADLLAARESQRVALRELRAGHLLAAPATRNALRHRHAATTRIDELEGSIRRLTMESRAKGVSAAARTGAEAEVEKMRAEEIELRQLVAESNRVQIADHSTATLHDRRTAALHDRLETQLYRLSELEKRLLPDLRFRLEWAEQIENLSIGTQEKAWQAAAQRVRTDPRFKGCELAPQIGLVPLGKDPKSDLEEFGHPLSGAVPKRGGDDKLTLTIEHGMVFVLVPGGELNTKNTKGVRLDPFFVGKHEMSRAQWERLARGVRGMRWRDGGIADVRNTGEMDKPVIGVSWFMCRDLLSNSGLMIPTTGQWEYCMSFEGGALQARIPKVCNLRDRSFAEAAVARGEPRPRVLNFDDGFPVLAPIASMEPTPGGFHHLLGNVSEWCRDTYFKQGEPPRTGDGMREQTANPNAPRIINGGDFLDTMPARLLDRRSPGSANRTTGIRAARQLNPGAAK